MAFLVIVKADQDAGESFIVGDHRPAAMVKITNTGPGGVQIDGMTGVMAPLSTRLFFTKDSESLHAKAAEKGKDGLLVVEYAPLPAPPGADSVARE